MHSGLLDPEFRFDFFLASPEYILEFESAFQIIQYGEISELANLKYILKFKSAFQIVQLLQENASLVTNFSDKKL